MDDSRVGGHPVPEDTSDTSSHRDFASTFPLSRRKKRRLNLLLAIVSGALVVVLGASIAISIVNHLVYSPEREVEEHLDAVIATDGAVTGYSITGVSISGDSAVVTADVVEGSDTEATNYSVLKSGKTAFVFDKWALEPN